MADEDDLISQVRVTGTKESEALLEHYADVAERSFKRQADAAKQAAREAAAAARAQEKAQKDAARAAEQAARDAEKASKQQSDAAKRAAAETVKAARDQQRALDQAAKAAGAELPRRLKEIENAAAGVTRQFQPLSAALGSFVARTTALATGFAASGVALALGARRVAQAVQGQSTALEDNTNRQIEANNAMLEGQVAQINYDASVRKLNQSLAKGEISFSDYLTQSKALRDDFNEQQRTAAEVANAQDRVKEANDRLTKSLKEQQAYQELVNTFGGPLTQALVAFGRQIEQVRTSFLSSFGPALANVVDSIGTVLAKNAPAINQFFSDASKKLNELVTKNGPEFERFLVNVGSGLARLFDGLIAVAPVIVSFFNDTLIPAIQKVMSALDGVASAINAAFGTNITGGFLIFIALLAQLTGSIPLFFNALKVGAGIVRALYLSFSLLTGAGIGPFLIAIAAAIAVIYLLMQVDWAGWLARGQAALNGIRTWLNNLGASASQTWTTIKNGLQTVVDYFAAFPDNLGAIFTALWEMIKAGWQASVDFVIQIWDGIVAYFSAFPQNLSNIWEAIKEAIISAFTTAVTTVKGLFNQLWTAAKQFLEPIIDMLKAIGTALGGAGQMAGGGQVAQFAGGGGVRGPGTGTSDSIPAWLSNGEFVIKAKSVAKYGSNFLHAINSGMFNPRRGFADGGLATIAERPSIINGIRELDGPAGGGAGGVPLTLQLFGETFEGLMAPEEVAGRLTRFAVQRSSRSAGRKPNWVGGRN